MKRSLRIKNLGFAAIAGLSGLVCVIVILAALFLGLYLDSLFRIRGLFTVGCLVGSVPVSLFLMLRLTLWMIGLINRRAADTKERSR